MKILIQEKKSKMTLKPVLIAVVIMLFLCGCANKHEIRIRNRNGKIIEKYIVNKGEMCYYSFHSNGSLKEEGVIKSGLREGLWKQYYSDGSIRWIGSYSEGEIDPPTADSTFIAKTKLLFKGITKDSSFAFRFKLPDSVSVESLIQTTVNASITQVSDFDSCDFLLKPNGNDTIIMEIRAITKYDLYTIYNKKITLSMLRSWKN
jgi:hypothetical protein